MQYNKDSEKELNMQSFYEYPSLEPVKPSKFSGEHHYVVIPVLNRTQKIEMRTWLERESFTNHYQDADTTFYNNSNLEVAFHSCKGALSNLERYNGDTAHAMSQVRLMFCVKHSGNIDFADRVEFDWRDISVVWDNMRIPLGPIENRQILSKNIERVITKNNRDIALDFMALATPSSELNWYHSRQI
jgi:hypothetical protein